MYFMLLLTKYLSKLCKKLLLSTFIYYKFIHIVDLKFFQEININRVGNPALCLFSLTTFWHHKNSKTIFFQK